MKVCCAWKPLDGGPTIGGRTTRDISPAIARAYEWERDRFESMTLDLHPAKFHGVDAYSVDEYITLNLGTDQSWGLTFRGCGRAAPILPYRGSIAAEKLIFNGGGPQTMSCLLRLEDLFYVGDPTLENGSQVTDCYTLIRTSTNIGVQFVNNRAYGLRCNGPRGLFDLHSMHLDVQNSYIHGCGHEDPTKGLVTVLSGIFGSRFSHFYIYPSEHHDGNTNYKDPFGGPAFEKSINAPAWGVRFLGEAPTNQPSHRLFQCGFGGAGSSGAILVDPLEGCYVYSVELDECRIRDNFPRVIKAVTRTKYVVLNNTIVQHGNAQVPTIELCDSTCENLSIDRSWFTQSAHSIDASNGQTSVRVTQSHGGAYDVTGCTNWEIDGSSTYDSLVGP